MDETRPKKTTSAKERAVIQVTEQERGQPRIHGQRWIQSRKGQANTSEGRERTGAVVRPSTGVGDLKTSKANQNVLSPAPIWSPPRPHARMRPLCRRHHFLRCIYKSETMSNPTPLVSTKTSVAIKDVQRRDLSRDYRSTQAFNKGGLLHLILPSLSSHLVERKMERNEISKMTSFNDDR